MRRFDLVGLARVELPVVLDPTVEPADTKVFPSLFEVHAIEAKRGGLDAAPGLVDRVDNIPHTVDRREPVAPVPELVPMS